MLTLRIACTSIGTELLESAQVFRAGTNTDPTLSFTIAIPSVITADIGCKAYEARSKHEVEFVARIIQMIILERRVVAHGIPTKNQEQSGVRRIG